MSEKNRQNIFEQRQGMGAGGTKGAMRGPAAGSPGGPGGKHGPGGGFGPGGFGRPVEKAKNFKGTLRRLIGYLKPFKINLLIVLIFAVASTTFAIVSPKIQGNAINKLTDGYMARTMLKEMTKVQNEAVDQIKEMMKGMGAGSAGTDKSQAETQIPPEAINALREMLELPMLDTVDDPALKADIVEKIMALGEKMPDLQQNNQQNMQSQKFTQEQIEDAIRAIRETGGKTDFTYILRIVVILLGLFLLSALFQFIMQWVMSSVAQKTSYQLRKDVDNKLARLPLMYYDSKTHGEILSRVTNDVDSISNTLQQSITQVITSVIQIIGYIIMMLITSPLLTLIVLATMPLYVFTTAFIAKKSQKFFAAQQKELGELSGHVEEMYTGHKIVKAFGQEKNSIEKFEGVNDKLYEAGWKAQFISGIMFPLMNFISNLGYVIICVLGGIWMTQNRLRLGDITAFIQYSKSFTMPIVQTANIANIIQSTIACAERVFEVLDEQEEIPDQEAAVVIEQPKGEVSFEKVDFRYVEGEPLIQDMNLSLKRGDTIAIVGPTGAGKTTLVNLLMRFYEINSGIIKIDGVDIKNIKRGALRGVERRFNIGLKSKLKYA